MPRGVGLALGGNDGAAGSDNSRPGDSTPTPTCRSEPTQGVGMCSRSQESIVAGGAQEEGVTCDNPDAPDGEGKRIFSSAPRPFPAKHAVPRIRHRVAVTSFEFRDWIITLFSR